MSSKIKKGDKVIVLTGDDKGNTGIVLCVLPKINKAMVEGVNMLTKHTKPTAEKPQSGITKKEAPIHLSNLAILDPKTNRPTRVGFKIEEGKKLRITKKSGDLILDEIKKK